MTRSLLRLQVVVPYPFTPFSLQPLSSSVSVSPFMTIVVAGSRPFVIQNERLCHLL